MLRLAICVGMLLLGGCAGQEEETAVHLTPAPKQTLKPVESDPCVDIDRKIDNLAGPCAREWDSGCGEDCPICDALNRLRNQRKGMIGCSVMQ